MIDALDLHDQVILITGGCGALGRAIVTTLAERGARVVVNDVLADAEANALLAGSMTGYLQGECESPADAAALIENTAEIADAHPTAVLCHAGLVESHPVESYPVETFDRLVATNLRGNFLLGQAAASYWISRGLRGHLIFTSSWVSEVPWPGIAPYSATKAALTSLTRSFARELAPRGIRANAIAPGIVGAGMALRQWETEPDYRARAERAIPLGELQPVSSVANAFLFLCSTLSSYMTGSVLTVDGGCSLYPMD